MIADQLKKAVLQAAIQGKLTEQLPEDGDARDLLEEIKAEKERMIKEGKIKKEKTLPEITEYEIPFDIPENWVWCRLNQIANYKKGPFGSSLTKSKFIPDGENAVKVYEQKNAIQQDHTLGSYFIKQSYYNKAMKGFTVVSGDILISCAGTIGSSYILPSSARSGIINQALMRTRVYPGIDKQFFLLLFDLAINTKEAKGKGSAIKNIPPFKILKNLIVPLPPSLEQSRILKKVEEILNEIEELRDDETKIESLQLSFPGQMKSSILQAAIQGKLTEQLSEDGDARGLLAEINSEKERLIKEGKIKKEKPLPEISEDEIPFDIPDNWEWCRLGDVTNYGLGRQVNKEKIPSDAWILELEDIEKDTYTLRKKRFDREPGSSKNKFFMGEVLYGKLRPYLKKVIIADEDGFCTTEVIPFKSYGDWIIPSYLKYFMVSPSTDYIINQITHGMDMPRLGTNKARKLIIPLPPLAEQQRIVARLEALLPLCDTIE